MTIKTHGTGNGQVAEIVSDAPVITDFSSGTDLVGSVYYGGFDKAILHASGIDAAFFDLKTGLAGEVLQKFSNYRIRVAIVGDFSSTQSSSLRDFIRESNRGGQVSFVSTLEEALRILSV